MTTWWKESSKKVIPYLNIQAKRDGSEMPGASDQGLLKKKGGRGFPYCTIMNANGDVIWEVRPTSKAAFETGVARATRLQQLKKKLAENPDDKGLAASVALLAGMGHEQRKGPTPDELAEHAKAQGVDAEVVGYFKEWRVGAEIMGALRKRDGMKLLYEMYKKGTVPPASFSFPEYYYMYAARGAVQAKDGEVAAKAAAKFAEHAAKMPDNRSGNAMRKLAEDLTKQAAELTGAEVKKVGEEVKKDG